MSLQKLYLNRLILNSYNINNVGLLYGRLGHVITLYELSNLSNHTDKIISFANFELERVVNHINKNSTISFENGLCGIGWGLEYLIKKGFIEGNSKEICEEIDLQIMQTDLKELDFTLGNGVEGVLHYVVAHLSNCYYQNKGMPFNSDFLYSLKEICNKIILYCKEPNIINLSKTFVDYFDNNKAPDYSFNISICTNNSLTYDTQSLALKNGICGLLIKMKNEGYDFTTCI